MLPETTYPAPLTPDFLRDCIDHAVALSFDRMPDHSWRRLSSDQPIRWILEHLDTATLHQLTVRRHDLDEQNERWNSDRHLELNLELRVESSTYLFSAELEHRYLCYLVERYALGESKP